MKSFLFKLDGNDLLKGLIVAVLGAVFATLAQWFNMPGFDLATFDWTELFKVGFLAGFAYLSKNFLSDDRGRVLGAV